MHISVHGYCNCFLLQSSILYVSAPTDKLFEKFRERFGQINVNYQNLQLWTWDNTRPYTHLVQRATETLQFLQQHLLDDDFGRDDYRELCELSIKYLGGQVMLLLTVLTTDSWQQFCFCIIKYYYYYYQSFHCLQVIRAQPRPNRVNNDDFLLRKPGALHHARFLASAIYIMKLVLLKNQLPAGLVTPNMGQKLERMAQFVSIFYTPWFLQARLAPLAPRLDVQLWFDMCKYEVIKLKQC